MAQAKTAGLDVQATFGAKRLEELAAAWAMVAKKAGLT